MGKYDSLEFALHQAEREALGDFKFFESGERYGAYQWTWTRRTKEKCVYVILAAEDMEGTTHRAINLEVWAAADQENRFGRAKVAELFAVPVDSGSDDGLRLSLVFLLNAARLRAEGLGFHELTRRYNKTLDQRPPDS